MLHTNEKNSDSIEISTLKENLQYTNKLNKTKR